MPTSEHLGARWAPPGLLAELGFQRAPDSWRRTSARSHPSASLFWLWWRGEAAPPADLVFVPSGRAAGLTCPTQGERGLRRRRRPGPGLRPRSGAACSKARAWSQRGVTGLPRGALFDAAATPRTSFQPPAGPHPKPARRPRGFFPAPRPPPGRANSSRGGISGPGAVAKGRPESRWAQRGELQTRKGRRRSSRSF